MPELLRPEESPKIDLAEAKDAYDRGTAIFVDVRSRESYDRAHIPGAISMPLMQVPTRAQELPHERLIILY